MKYLLTIAGHDPSSGAGIVADINSGQALDVPSLSVITCLTVQSATGGLDKVIPLSVEVIKEQLDKLFADYEIGAIKLGALASEEIVVFLANYLKNITIPIVLDPVIQSSKGKQLLESSAFIAFKKKLLPLITVITPNLAEAELLTGIKIFDEASAIQAAQALLDSGVGVVSLTGGHRKGKLAADLVLEKDKKAHWVINNKLPLSAHGTGCSFASVLAGGVIKGWTVLDSAIAAKYLVTKGIVAGKAINSVKLWNSSNSAEYFPWLANSLASQNSESFPKINESLGIYPLVATLEHLQQVITAGFTTVQLRIKQGNSAEIKQQVFAAVELVKSYPKVRLFINDYWQYALKAGAYGVHLGQEDWQALSLADKQTLQSSGIRLGISCHNLTELALAHKIAPSYLALGPVFTTKSKQLSYETLGISNLKLWVSWLKDKYLLVAIGGINLANLAQIKRTGVSGAALIQAAKSESLQELINRWEE